MMEGPMFPAPEFGLIALFFFIVNVAFIVLLVVLVVLAIRWLLRSLSAPSGPTGMSAGAGDSATTEDTALALLRERFARGEIDADEYEQRRRTLGS
jgi:putative membrane protein